MNDGAENLPGLFLAVERPGGEVSASRLVECAGAERFERREIAFSVSQEVSVQ